MVCKCFCVIHRHTCPMSLIYHGEKRWLGADGAISRDDYTFVQSLKPALEWWDKAWGRPTKYHCRVHKISRVFLTIALGADVNAVVWACVSAIYALHRTECSTMLVHDSGGACDQKCRWSLDYSRVYATLAGLLDLLQLSQAGYSWYQAQSGPADGVYLDFQQVQAWT